MDHRKGKTQHGRDLSGKEMAEMLDEFLNSYDTTQVAEFVQHATCSVHRTLQQRMMGLFVLCIEAWAIDFGGHDARNEATVKLAKKIVAATGDVYDRFLPNI